MLVFVGLFSWVGGFSREDSLELLPGAQNPHCQQLGPLCLVLSGLTEFFREETFSLMWKRVMK